ncbi:MAG TPA: YhgE/Pip domain-containing protein [Propionibacteriaceae bacterium]
MVSLERAHSTRRVGVWSIVGLLLVPLVLAGGFLLATWKSDTRLDRVQAAVVNLDEPIKLDGQTVPLGRQLAGGLVNGNDDDQNFSWLLTDASDAAAGLDSGRYAAVVTIPKSFSANATSYSKNNADVEPATLSVATSDVSGIADPVVGQAITAAATKALNTQLTEAYLKNIYVGFNDTGKQFATVADAAGKLADGTTSLAKGINQTSDGTVALADGLGQLSTGGKDLASGADELSTGVSQYADGVHTLAEETASLPAGARKLADGTEGIAGGLKTYQRELRKQADAAGSVKQPTAPTAESLGKALAALPPSDAPAPTCPTTEPALTEAQCQVVLQTIGGVAQEAGEQGAEQGLTVAGQQFGAYAKDLATYAGSQGAAKALDGAAGGLSTKDPKTGGSLISGASQLADGTDALADGLKPLAAGIKQLDTGAAKLATGTAGLSDGIAQYTDGVSQSATGTEKLSAGVIKLADGGDKLADGTTKLADGLEKGAKEIPTYNERTREKLSEVVATPVTTPQATSVFSDVATTTLLAVLALWIGGLATYLVVRAISGRVLSSMKSSWRLAAEALAPGAVIAVVQALALTVMLQALLKLDAAQLAQLAGFALLTGLAFVALNQALVAWFGGIGRFVSVVVVVAAAAGSITGAVPEVFDAVLPVLPLTPALEGFRSIVTDSGASGGPTGLLLAWLLIGLVGSVLAVARRRVVAPLVVPAPA